MKFQRDEKLVYAIRPVYNTIPVSGQKAAKKIFSIS